MLVTELSAIKPMKYPAIKPMKYSAINPVLLLCAALVLGALPLAAQVIEDDFNDGNDAGWSRYLPLQDLGAPATFSFPNGNSYRIQSGASPLPEQLALAGPDPIRKVPSTRPSGWRWILWTGTPP